MFKRFLLGRGLNKLQEILNKGVRHYGGSAAGGYLIAEGLASGSDVQTASGALLTLVSFGVSVARAIIDKRT